MKVIALGNDTAGDDGAALLAAHRLVEKIAAAATEKIAAPENVAVTDIVFAGRPGAGLLDLLDRAEPVILLDVVTGSGPPGCVVRLTFEALINGINPGRQVSSHGFGPAEALQLGRALGRSLPAGCFVGIEGQCFEPGRNLSAPVSRAMGEFVGAIQTAISDFICS